MLHLVQVLASDARELPGLVEAEVRDRELVRVVDRLADDPGVAAAGAVPRRALLEDADRQRRLELLEKQGRPEPREPGADDGDVGRDLAREPGGRPRRPRGHPVAGLLDRGKRQAAT